MAAAAMRLPQLGQDFMATPGAGVAVRMPGATAGRDVFICGAGVRGAEGIGAGMVGTTAGAARCRSTTCSARAACLARNGAGGTALLRGGDTGAIGRGAGALGRADLLRAAEAKVRCFGLRALALAASVAAV